MSKCRITKYLAGKLRPAAVPQIPPESNPIEIRGELRMAARLEDMHQELLAVTKALQLVIEVASRALPDFSPVDRIELGQLADYLGLFDQGGGEHGKWPSRESVESNIVRIAETRKIHYARVDLVLVSRLIIAIVAGRGHNA